MNKISTLLSVPTMLLLLLFNSACRQNVLDRVPRPYTVLVEQALQQAGENRPQIEAFLRGSPAESMTAASFLVAYMPPRDLTSLSADFLKTNLEYAMQVRAELAWQKEIPDSIFFNYVLPYVNIHERRDNWRPDFYRRFAKMVRDSKSIGEAVVALNNSIWDSVNVHYNTRRPKADQSPYESMEAQMATCTGLSILLVDACRAVGIPARFVGVPLWTDHSGNHSWVEIWDKDWHYIGAGEPGPLDKTWFAARAALANDSDWKYRIYAVSYKKTGLHFPLLWDSTATYVCALNVTSFYQSDPLAEGKVFVRIRVVDRQGRRRAVRVKVMEGDQTIGQGRSRDERFDRNDLLTFYLAPGSSYRIMAEGRGQKARKIYRVTDKTEQIVELTLR